MGIVIRRCENRDFQGVYEIINESARCYKGVIPNDRWKEPYMTREELAREIKEGVVFWGAFEKGGLLGVMGLQGLGDVTLIRHAYVLSNRRNQGIGGKLLETFCKKSKAPLLVGTWKAAEWAIRFYEKHGFKLVASKEKDLLLGKYWTIPPRQIETSVVLKLDHG